jgi:hypothetical protein
MMKESYGSPLFFVQDVKNATLTIIMDRDRIHGAHPLTYPFFAGWKC